MSFRSRLILAFVASSFALLSGTLIPIGIASSRSNLQTYVEQRTREARTVVAALRGRDERGRRLLIMNRYPVQGISAGWLIDPRDPSRSIVSNPEAFPSSWDVPEVRRAMSGPDAHVLRETRIGERLFVAVPVIDDASLRGVLWVSTTLRPVEVLNRRTLVTYLVLGLFGLVASALLGVAIGRAFARRLERVTDGANRFASGHLSERIELEGRDEIAKLGEDLNTMAARVRDLLEHEKEFVAAASHQLRTPLAAILVRIDEVRNALPPGEARTYVEEIVAEVEHLRGITTRLLDLSAIADERSSVSTDVMASLDHVAARIRPLGQQKNVVVQVTGDGADAVVRSARGAFDEVMFNLVDNAVKFSPPGTLVEVRASADEQRVRVEVVDQGTGIAPSLNVGMPFTTTSRSSGYGLGLAICHRICRAAGATLELYQGADGGTVARLDWPRVPPADAGSERYGLQRSYLGAEDDRPGETAAIPRLSES